MVDLQCLSISAVQQSDPVLYIYTYTYIYIYIYIPFAIFSILFHHKWLDIVPSDIQQGLIAYPLQMQ